MNKTVIYAAITAGGLIGGWLFGLLDHGNYFGVWGILGSLIGSLLGIFVVYKAHDYFGY